MKRARPRPKNDGTAPINPDIGAELLIARTAVPLQPGPDGVGVEISNGVSATREQKKNFAQVLSDALALKLANGLRADFPGVLPARDITGGVVRGNESPVRTLKGVKRLDVNFSTVQLGLGLGVSVKTLNFRDPRSGRYTKNVTRIDNEMRAEAGDYHDRQPFAVLAAIVFMPVDAATDGVKGAGISSFAHAALTFRFRAGRGSHRDGPDLFERVFIALYEATPEREHSPLVCFDVTRPPPKDGLPRVADQLTLPLVLDSIKAAFYERNVPKRIFAESEDGADISRELDDLARADPDLFARDDDSAE